MRRNKFSDIIAGILAIVVVTLALASGTAAASEYKVLHAFTWAQGPLKLVRDASGSLYGMTNGGGAHGWGVVFKVAPSLDGVWTVKILYSFPSAYPSGGLILDTAGNLYGTTGGGGTYGKGVVFKLSPKPDGTWCASVLHNFAGSLDGSLPLSTLVFDAAGNLYGTTYLGGDVCEGEGCGTVFKLAPDADGTWTESVIYNFTNGADGAYPGNAALILDAAGNLYGVNGGEVFKLAPNSDGEWSFATVYGFSGGAGGGDVVGSLVFDAAGNLYGTAAFGGITVGNVCADGGCGTVFKLTPGADGTWTESVIHSFTGGADGSTPLDGLVFDATGNLYGTAMEGGSCSLYWYGCGVVFKLAPTSSGWNETVLHSFLGYGYWPQTAVTLDSAGNIYGTTSKGTNNGGIVFEIAP